MERTVMAEESMSYAVSCAVAEVEGCRPADLPPLHDTLDVDALDALFPTETDRSSRCEGSLMFDYSDSSVTIWSDRSVTVSIVS